MEKLNMFLGTKLVSLNGFQITVGLVLLVIVAVMAWRRFAPRGG